MNDAQKKELYQKAMMHFGYKNQLLKAVEEMSEFSQAIIKDVLRNECEYDSNFLEEYADSCIMLEQVYITFSVEEKEQIFKISDRKLERLKGKINE